MNSLSVVIPTFNNSKYLDLCLTALRENSELNNEILIHMDGCTDDTESIVKEFMNMGLSITLTSSEHKGLYSSVNSAMRNATKDYFLLINDDIVVSPGWDKSFLKACKPNRVMCPWMVEAGNGSYTQGVVFGENTPEKFKLADFNEYCNKNKKDEFVVNWTVGMWSARRELFEIINGCDEAFNPFGCGGTEILYRLKILYPEYEFGAHLGTLVYHFSAACKRENNRDHLVNLYTWDDKYTEVTGQEANDLLEGNRGYKPIESTPQFKERCLHGHLGKGLV